MSAFRQFSLYQPMQTTTSTTWSGLQAISPRCYGCIYSYVKYGTLICGHASRTVANGLRGQDCVSFVPRNETDAQPERLYKEGERHAQEMV